MKAKRIEKEVKVFEGFCGIGVTRLAIDDVSKELGINVAHVGNSEIEPCAVKAYRALHGNDAINYGDVTKIDWSKMDVDFLSWTFPCQSISSAGANDGFVNFHFFL